MQHRVTFNYITSVLLLWHQMSNIWYQGHSTEFQWSQSALNVSHFRTDTVQNWGWAYIFIGFAWKRGLDKMANKTDNTLYWIYNLTVSWHFLSLSVTMTWWRSHYPAECSRMFSQLWRGLMWAFSYIQLPLEEEATWGNWAAEWVRKSNCWNDRKAIQFNFAVCFCQTGA